MIVPLLDHSDPENLERFNELCKIFFKEYDKDEDGYIGKHELKEPINEIVNHFSIKGFGYCKLKMLFGLVEEGNKKS